MSAVGNKINRNVDLLMSSDNQYYVFDKNRATAPMCREPGRISVFDFLLDCWLIQNFLRSVISKQILLDFLYLQENAKRVPNFDVTTACLSSSSPYLN
jgi:hypothetical protein